MSDDKNFHDVARPGSVDPQHTSRPTIVGKAELAHDPMMKEQEEAPHLAPHGEAKLKPPTLTAESIQAQQAAEAVPSELDGPDVVAKDRKAEAAEKDKQLMDEKVQQFIDDKTYAVPVGHLQRKRTLHTLLIAGIIVVIVAAIGFVLLSR